jgi:hypothetical protein
MCCVFPGNGMVTNGAGTAPMVQVSMHPVVRYSAMSRHHLPCTGKAHLNDRFISPGVLRFS